MDRPEDGEGIVRELSGFTPGPWETNEAEHDCPYQDVVIRDTKGRGICRIWFDDAPVPDYNAEQSANVRLIKSAPALLARIMLDAQEKAALQAELARLKEVAHNNAERSNANYVAMQSALEFIDLTIERREAFAEYRAAHPKEGA